MSEKWENLHKGLWMTELHSPLKDAWQRCINNGMNPYANHIPVVDSAAFEKAKSESYTTYVSGNRLLKSAAMQLGDECIGFAFFSKEACLLKLYGNMAFKEWAAKKGLVVGADCSEGSIGPSAVSLGLRYERTFVTSGEQHFIRALSDVKICFAPCRIDRPLEGGRYPFRPSGIAVIGPAEAVGACASSLAYSIAEAISLRGFFSKANPLIRYQAFTQQCILAVDQDKDKMSIISVDSNLCQNWNMTETELFYRELGDVVQRNATNKEFWDIVDTKKTVADYPITIQVKDQKQKYFLTSWPYFNSIMDFSGLLFNLKPVPAFTQKAPSKKSFSSICTFDAIIGNSPQTEKTKQIAKNIASGHSNILILGESGVGKDIYSQAIHNSSPRSNGPFVAVNCAAFPKDLFASELFGYETGAYTGAKSGGNIGKFELADGGTLFLDEIGDMPLECQAILLRAIENKTFMRLGSGVERKADVRIIAATNADLREKVARKEFREDLYYRLAVMCLYISPLRQRKEDIVPLADYFMRNCASEAGKTGMALSASAADYLSGLQWKGNVRELKHLIESIVQFYSADTIYPEHIEGILQMRSDLFFSDQATISIAEVHGISVPYDMPKNKSETTTKQKRKKIAAEEIRQSLEKNKYNKSHVAAELGCSRKTLYKLMEDYGIE